MAALKAIPFLRNRIRIESFGAIVVPHQLHMKIDGESAAGLPPKGLAASHRSGICRLPHARIRLRPLRDAFNMATLLRNIQSPDDKVAKLAELAKSPN